MAVNPSKMLVIIPAYNEGCGIRRLVQEIKSVDTGLDMEILVIDDGSTDNTAPEARAAGARVISLIQNLGYGHALKTGYMAALAEDAGVVVQMDGDGQHAPQSIPSLAAPLLAGECDMVIGSRALSDTHYPMPLARRIGQRFFSWVLGKMGGMKIMDPTSGFQILGPKVLALFMSEDFPGDYPDTNVLLFLQLHGVRVREMPAVFRVNERGTSMHSGVLRPAYYIYSMLISMLMVYWRHHTAGAKGGRDGQG